MTEGPERSLSDPFDRQVLWSGVVLWAILATEIGWLAIALPAIGQNAFIATITGLFMGREAGIPTGIALGVPPLLMMQLSFTLDLASGATAYGVLMRLLDHPGRMAQWARRLVHKVTEDARQRQGFVVRWGRWGAFLFMLVPFMVNGPLLVAMLGRMSGLDTKDLAAPIVLATVIAASAWAMFSDVLLGLLEQVNDGLEIVATGVFLGAMLGITAWNIYKAQRNLRRMDDQ